MKIFFITVGQPKLAFVKEGLNEYLKRVSGFAPFHFSHIKENKKTDEAILKMAAGKKLILLDEKGILYSTQELARVLEKRRLESVDLCFVVGGADGHSDFLRERADALWSLSALTCPHDFASLLGVEALYRALSLLHNHPYHRD